MALTQISLATAGLKHAAGPEITSSGSVRISDSALITFMHVFGASDCSHCRAGRVRACERAMTKYGALFLARRRTTASASLLVHCTPPIQYPYAQYILLYPPNPPRTKPASLTSQAVDPDAFAVQYATTAICARASPSNAPIVRRRSSKSDNHAPTSIAPTYASRPRTAEVPPEQRAGT